MNTLRGVLTSPTTIKHSESEYQVRSLPPRFVNGLHTDADPEIVTSGIPGRGQILILVGTPVAFESGDGVSATNVRKL